MFEKVSDKTLKEDVIKYKKLHKKTFTLSVHIKIEEIEHRAEKIFENFEQGKLSLAPSQYALFARYINTFSRQNKDRYFDKLQKMADFDVRESAQYAERTWWQKMFDIDPNAIKYMPAKVLEKKTNRYIKDMERLENSQYAETVSYNRGERVRIEAQDYMQAYVDGKVAMREEDAEAFARYVKTTFYPIYPGCIAEKALDKLKKDDFSAAKTEEKPKAKLIKINTPSTHSLLKWGKAAAVGLVACVSSMLIFNGDKEANGMPVHKNMPQTAKTVAKKIPHKVTKAHTIGLEEAVKQIETKKQVEEKITFADSIKATPEAVIKHHDYILFKRLGKKQRAKLYKDVQKQIEDKIFVLPEGMSFHEFAYAFAMYRAYGVKSSLASALKSQTKLTVAENQQIVSDIVAAGYNGVGVKKMADKLHKNINLKQWRQAKKQAGLAA